MMSYSQWGMFPAPHPVFVMPELTKEQEAEFREAMMVPGNIVWLPNGPRDVFAVADADF